MLIFLVVPVQGASETTIIKNSREGLVLGCVH